MADIVLNLGADYFYVFQVIDRENTPPVLLNELNPTLIVEKNNDQGQRFKKVATIAPDGKTATIHFTEADALFIGKKPRQYMIYTTQPDGVELLATTGSIYAEGFTR